jgi:uncharacterized protein (DUF779 family)
MSEKQVPLHELEGLCISSIEESESWDEAIIELSDGTTITVVHQCCGCCDGPYTICATRVE